MYDSIFNLIDTKDKERMTCNMVICYIQSSAYHIIRFVFRSVEYQKVCEIKESNEC